MNTIHRLSLLALSFVCTSWALSQDHGDPQALTLKMIHANQNAELHISIGDEVLTIDPNELAIGDTHTYNLPNTDAIAVTRHEAGWTVAVGDDTFEVAAAADMQGTRAFVTDHQQVVIHGLDYMDESTQQMIRDAMRAAGVDQEIRFAASPDHGYRFKSDDGGVRVFQVGDDQRHTVWVTDGKAIQGEGLDGQKAKIHIHRDGDQDIEVETNVLVIDKQAKDSQRDQ